MKDPTNPRRPLEDVRVELARIALAEHQAADLGAMTEDDAFVWMGRLVAVADHLLDYVDQQLQNEQDAEGITADISTDEEAKR